jgi:hypothetical protein
MRRFLFLLIPVGLGVSMSCNQTQNGTLKLLYGDDDPFTESDASAPTSISILAASEDPDGGSALDGNWSSPATLIRSDYPVTTLNLPSLSTDDIDTIEARLFDSADASIIFGQTIPVQLGGVTSIADLPIFVQRTGQFARLPSPLLPSAVPALPLAALFENRFILVADGSGKGAGAELYDLLFWGLVETVDAGMAALTLPCNPLSIAPIAGTTFMFVVCSESAKAGGDLLAYQVDVSGGGSVPISAAPGGPMWRDIAGGATIISPNGDAFIVGATRLPSGPVPGATSAVLKLPTAQDLGVEGGATTVIPSWLTLAAQREGATALWSSPTYGLVVVGGNSHTGDTGIEYFGETSAQADGGMPSSSLTTYPYDPTQGAGAVAMNGNQILVSGGKLPDGSPAPTRLFRLPEGSDDCTTTTNGADGGDGGQAEGGQTEGGQTEGGNAGEGGEAGEAGPDASAPTAVPLLTAQGFVQGGADPMFIGSEKDGTTHAFLVPLNQETSCPMTPTEVPLRVSKRKGTTAILTPLPSVIVIGGDTTMESYIP